jgi:tRNA 5-methylaminomethyl-2-thiouridine biosynthesis bifunctional protein
VRAARLVRDGDAWAVFDEAGLLLARAPVVVLANSHDAVRLAGLRYAPMRRVRGQLTYLPAPLDEPFANGLGHRFATALRIPVIGDGYAAPLQLPLKLPFGLPRNGGLVTGASYELDDDDMSLRASSHRENLVRLSRLVPALARDLAQLDPSGLAGRVGFRCVAGDRLPFAGALADETACERNSASLAGAHPLDLPRAEGLYAAFAFGSRGLVWSSLVAELIASQIEGEPWPMERDLAESLDPGRYLLRALRRGLNV